MVRGGGRSRTTRPAATRGFSSGSQGPPPAGLRHALESLKAFDLGIGATLSFGPDRHQGLDSVYFTRVDGERWVPITDWASAVQA